VAPPTVAGDHMETSIKRQNGSRVADGLSLLQEDALVGLMFDDFEATQGQSLDYDKVKRYAVSIQTDPEICDALDVEPIEVVEDAWEPDDDWITNMCHAFTDARRNEAKKKERTAFGGSRVEYDPKNPYGGRGGGSGGGGVARSMSPAPRAMQAKAGRLASQRAAAAESKQKLPGRKKKYDVHATGATSARSTRGETPPTPPPSLPKTPPHVMARDLEKPEDTEPGPKPGDIAARGMEIMSLPTNVPTSALSNRSGWSENVRQAKAIQAPNQAPADGQPGWGSGWIW